MSIKRVGRHLRDLSTAGLEQRTPILIIPLRLRPKTRLSLLRKNGYEIQWRSLSNLGQNTCEIQNSQLQKKYASLLTVTKTKFPTWNDLDAQHIVTLFLLKLKVDCLYTPSRKKRVLITRSYTNRTGLYIIEKRPELVPYKKNLIHLAQLLRKTTKNGHLYFCEPCGLIFTTIKSILCFRQDDGIVASKFLIS